MIRQDIDINGYWKIIVIYNAYLGKKNTGFTHSNLKNRVSIVGISKATSLEQLLNTIAHEAKHVQSHVCKYYKVKEDSESAAYLMGYIVGKMYNKFKELL